MTDREALRRRRDRIRTVGTWLTVMGGAAALWAIAFPFGVR